MKNTIGANISIVDLRKILQQTSNLYGLPVVSSSTSYCLATAK